MKRNLILACWLVGALLLAPLSVQPTPAAAAAAGVIVLEVDRPTQGEQLEMNSSFGGWAVDLTSPYAPGISAISIFMDGDSTTGRFLGEAKLGGHRPDVAAALGNPAYATAGWSFNLAGLGLTGQHSFTVVAYGGDGTATSQSVAQVTLVPSLPAALTGQSNLQYSTHMFNTSAASTATAYQPAPPATTYQTAAPIYQPAPTTYSVTPVVPATTVAVVPAAPAALPPAMVAPVPASLSVTSLANGATIGTATLVSGITSVVPVSGSVTYRLTDSRGVVLSSGTLSVSGTPGQAGTFSGIVTAPAGVAGPATLTIIEQDRGSVVGMTSLSISLAGYALPAPVTPWGTPAYPLR